MVADPEVTKDILIQDALYDLREESVLDEKVHGLKVLSMYVDSLDEKAYQTFLDQRELVRPAIEKMVDSSLSYADSIEAELGQKGIDEVKGQQLRCQLNALYLAIDDVQRIYE